MIVFDRDGWRFNYRVAGILIDGGRVLVERGVKSDLTSLPGGRVDWGESATDAILREAREELGITPRIERLVWVVDNFFSLNNRRYHELSFYFLLSIPKGSDVCARRGAFPNLDVPHDAVFEWHALDRLHNISLQPSFLRDGLRRLPETPVYLTHRDESIE